ncbi:MAG: hypothetical protein RLY57_679 [Candidatus Parcubacteria bacterium]|jgi:hypothetical protein
MNPLSLSVYSLIVTAAVSAGVSLDEVFHEHSAIRAVPDGEMINGRVDSLALTLTGPGMWLRVKEFGEENQKPHTVFLQCVRHPRLRLELLGQKGVPEHEAFRVLGFDNYTLICDKLIANQEFEHLDALVVQNDNTHARLFRHTKSRVVIQIIWRHPKSVFFGGDMR